jgi:hypothetical protein
MNDIQLQMCILLYREHLDELQRKHLELQPQLRTSQQTIAHSCKLLAGLDALLGAQIAFEQTTALV